MRQFGSTITPRQIAILLCSLACLHVAAPSGAKDGTFPVQSNLKAGVAKVDITPKDVKDFEVTGHRRKVTGVRDPLRAAVLVLDDGETKAAIVTMDTISAWNEMVALVRSSIDDAIGVPAANIMVAASHNHSGPLFEADSPWGRMLVEKVTAAAKEAAAN